MVRMLVERWSISPSTGGRRTTSVLLQRDPAVITSPPAPAQGLYFMMAVYPEEWFALT
ncbi:MAG: hypothetical protein R2882_03140 [Gemmatimonadales bacterium]